MDTLQGHSFQVYLSPFVVHYELQKTSVYECKIDGCDIF